NFCTDSPLNTPHSRARARGMLEGADIKSKGRCATAWAQRSAAVGTGLGSPFLAAIGGTGAAIGIVMMVPKPQTVGDLGTSYKADHAAGDEANRTADEC